MRNKLLAKYTFSYFAVFFVLMITAYGVSNHYLIKSMKKNAVDMSVETASFVYTSLDREFATLKNTAYEISQNDYLSPIVFQESPLDARRIIKILNAYYATSSFVDDLFLSYNVDNYLYTPLTTSNYSLYFSNFIEFDGMSADQVAAIFENCRKMQVFPVQNMHTQLDCEAVCVLLPATTTRQTGVCGFVIDHNTISQYLLEHTENQNVFSAITYGDQTLYSTPDHPLSGYSPAAGDRPESGSFVTIDGADYLFFSATSQKTGLTYDQYFPMDHITSAARMSTKILTFFLVGLLLLAMVLICMVSYLNYNPIKKIYAYTQKMLHKGEGQRFTGLSDIRDNFDQLYLENTSLIDMTTINVTLKTDKLMYKILHGEINGEEFDRQAAELGISLLGDRMCCMVCSIHTGDYAAEIEAVLAYLSGFGSSQFHLLYHIPVLMDKLVIFVHTNESSVALKEFTLALHRHIREGMGIPVVSGVGSVCPDIAQAKRSYNEAKIAISQQYSNEREGYVLYKNTAPNLNAMILRARSCTDIIIYSILRDDLESLHRSLKNYCDFLKDSSVPFYIAKALSFNLLINIHDVMTDGPKREGAEEDYPDILSLAASDTLDEVVDGVLTAFQQLKGAQKNKTAFQEEEENDVLNQMLKYLNENFDNCDFSVGAMAEAFHMSSPNLCQYFRLHINATVTSYVTNLRMQKACQLLKSTDRSIDEIAEAVGYINTQSFTRRFKKEFGVTPNAYRKLK